MTLRTSVIHLRRACGPDCGGWRFPGQRGQALLEGLVALLVLLSLWVGIAWVARFQDMALQASHASRFAAFSLTRHPQAKPITQLRWHYFSGPAHQWAQRDGGQLLGADRSEVSLTVTQTAGLPLDAQPGGNMARAVQLRREWLLEDLGVANARVAVALRRDKPAQASTGLWGSELRQFDTLYPVLTRHTAILVGAGHAASDADAQHRVAGSDLAWGEAARNSYSLGEKISARMQAVDGGWNRPAPQFDWLSPWQGRVPGFHLGNAKEQP